MNAETIAALASAGASIVGSMMCVLLLAYRVGKLTGTVEARISASEKDYSWLRGVVETLSAAFHKHLEGHK